MYIDNGGGLLWDAGVTSPHLRQNSQVSDVATNSLTVQAQAAFGGSTGANRNGGHAILRGGAKDTGGVDGSAIMRNGAGTTIVEAADGNKLGFYAAAPVTQASRAGQLTDNTGGAANNTVEAIPDPADTPATADALRDDLVANTLPAIRNDFADLVAKVNALELIIHNLGLSA